MKAKTCEDKPCLTDFHRHFACVRTDHEIQGFSHKTTQLLRNRKERMKTERQGNIREDNILAKDKSKQESVKGLKGNRRSDGHIDLLKLL